MESPLTWELKRETGGTLVTLTGEVTENTRFSNLVAQLQGVVTLDLAGVRRVNSAGVREWIDFVAALGGKTSRLSFVRCSVAIVHQLNMIEGFRGGADVKSVYAPYFCGSCNEEHTDLVDLPPGPVSIADTLPCPKCGSAMEFDELPQYLSFRDE